MSQYSYVSKFLDKCEKKWKREEKTVVLRRALKVQVRM